MSPGPAPASLGDIQRPPAAAVPAPAAPTPEPLITLELLGRLIGPAGQLWLPGEKAGFTTKDAADLVERGIARPAPAKAPAAPERDKMLQGADVRKK